MLVLLVYAGSALVLKAVETAWKRCISVDFGDEKSGKRLKYWGKDVFMRRVRIEAPEMFRVLGKRKPEFVMPYLERLDYIATHDENRIVRIHAEGAMKAVLSKVTKEPDVTIHSISVKY